MNALSIIKCVYLQNNFFLNTLPDTWLQAVHLCPFYTFILFIIFCKRRDQSQKHCAQNKQNNPRHIKWNIYASTNQRVVEIDS